MRIDNKLWIFAYSMASKSAAELADTLDCWILKHKGSAFEGEAGRYILNWGAGTDVFNARVGDATVLNTPAQIDLAVNKLDFFKGMGKGDASPRLPSWTSQKARAQGWMDCGKTVIARTKLEGAKGEGLVVCKEGVDIPDASLYTMKVESTHEFRVYMFNGEAIDIREKKLAEGQQPDPNDMRYAEDKYEFCPVRDEVPQDVYNQACLAIRKTGLLTGGVDVLWNAENQRATVLEVNTAPYLGENTAAKYAKAIKAHITNLEAKRRAA